MAQNNLKICIIRLSALGDVTLFLPTLNAIKQSFPQAQITWIIGALEYKLVEGIEGVEFIIYDKKSGIKGAFELRKKLANRRFDTLLMVQEALRASLLSLMIRADIKLGYDFARAKDLQWLFSNRRIKPHKNPHMMENFLDFARYLGAKDLSIKWNLPVPQSAYEEAKTIIEQPYMLISPCTNIVRNNWRDWTTTGYREVIDFAYENYGLQTVLTGGKSEKERRFVDEIISLAKSPVVDALGKTSIKGLLALIARARVVIAPDSGPGHFAAALGVPTISLIAAANPQRAAPIGSLVADRYKEALLKYAGKNIDEVPFGTRVRHIDAMSLISADDVISLLQTILKENDAKDNR